MANLATNPWSFTGADVQVQTISTITLNADGSVTVVGVGNLTAGMVQEAFVTIVGVTNALYNGFYKITAVTSATTAVLLPLQSDGQKPPTGTAASAGGTIILTQWRDNERIEDLSWQNITAAGDKLIIYDRNGFLLWSATGYAAGFQNRGKLFWCHGFAIAQMDSGTLLATIN
jgi:hypothetical protein